MSLDGLDGPTYLDERRAPCLSGRRGLREKVVFTVTLLR